MGQPTRAASAGAERPVHSQVRRGIAEGLSRDELRHVAFLAITTLGFPKAVAALTWIEDIVEEGGEALAEWPASRIIRTEQRLNRVRRARQQLTHP